MNRKAKIVPGCCSAIATKPRFSMLARIKAAIVGSNHSRLSLFELTGICELKLFSEGCCPNKDYSHLGQSFQATRREQDHRSFLFCLACSKPEQARNRYFTPADCRLFCVAMVLRAAWPNRQNFLNLAKHNLSNIDVSAAVFFHITQC
jgi:hypothetical protein